MNKYVPLKEYLSNHINKENPGVTLTYDGLLKRVKKGLVPGAKKIGGRWYVWASM